MGPNDFTHGRSIILLNGSLTLGGLRTTEPGNFSARFAGSFLIAN